MRVSVCIQAKHSPVRLFVCQVIRVLLSLEITAVQISMHRTISVVVALVLIYINTTQIPHPTVQFTAYILLRPLCEVSHTSPPLPLPPSPIFVLLEQVSLCVCHSSLLSFL